MDGCRGGSGRVNKIKFSPKNEWDMINVCHVGSRIEENETTHTFEVVFPYKLNNTFHRFHPEMKMANKLRTFS